MNISKDKTNISYPTHLKKEFKLADSTVITIRPIHPNDADLIKEFSRNLSNELKHLNYMEVFKELPDNMVTRLTQVDYKKTMTLIATVEENKKETVIGMVHYLSIDGANCEFDMIVTDAWQNKGIGRELTKMLIQTAKDNGIKLIRIFILSSNLGGMLLAKHFGFSVEKSDDPTVNIVSKTLV